MIDVLPLTSEFQRPPDTFNLNEQSGISLNDWLVQHNFSLLGHGTPFSDPESFFDKGVLAGRSNGQVGNVSLPIGFYRDEKPDSNGSNVANMDFMKDWPHKRSPSQPTNVALLAFPNGEKNISAGDIDRNMISEDDEDFPAELVVGFFNAESGDVVMNPDFNPTEDLRAKYLEKTLERLAETRAAYEKLYVKSPKAVLPGVKIDCLDDSEGPDVFDPDEVW